MIFLYHILFGCRGEAPFRRNAGRARTSLRAPPSAATRRRTDEFREIIRFFSKSEIFGPLPSFFVGETQEIFLVRFILQRGAYFMTTTNTSEQPLDRSESRFLRSSVDSEQDQPEDLTTPEILPPTNDWIFKLLFGDERHKDNLINLLKSFIALPEEEYELIFLDTHLKPECKHDKLGILDVKVKTKSGKVINIEIQVDPFKDIGKRISFYKSKLIVGQIAESQEYDAIQDVLCICIFKKAIFPKVKEYVNRFQFMNPANGLLFAGIPEIVYTADPKNTKIVLRPIFARFTSFREDTRGERRERRVGMAAIFPLTKQRGVRDDSAKKP